MKWCHPLGWGVGLLVLLLAAPTFAMAADPYAELGVVKPRERLPAPDFSLPRLDGGTVRLEAFSGKVVLLNFWATWCAPCLKEMPALEALWRRHRDQGLVVLAVNVDRGKPKSVAKWVDRLGLTLPVALDREGGVRRDYEVIAMPMTYLIGADGRFLGKVVGERVWDGDAADRLIESALADATK